MHRDAVLSILVVDDVPLIRDAVKILLTQGDYARIVGEAANGRDAIKAAENVNPDIILMDIDMPIMDGIEAAKIIRQKNANTKILMLTSSSSEKMIFSSFAAGAEGYILKDKFPGTLKTAITTVCLGSVWLDPAIARRILELAVERSSTSEAILTSAEVATLNEVACCKGGSCLVDPSFVSNLRRLDRV